jgi:glycosyltransferase involved in cell wall biosynthesis
MNINPFFSICIPAYEMRGCGLDFLKFNLKTFKQQSFSDFEVVISDHSQNDDIENLCKESDLKIKYIKNSNNIGNSSANINNAIKNASGKWIKVLFQDDFLYGKNALLDLRNFILQNFQTYSDNCDENGIFENNDNLDEKGWVVTASEHTTDGNNLINPYQPRWSLEAIQKGHNTISSPSVLCFKNDKDNIFFDENLNWFMDLDYYYRLFLKYGEPKILNSINAVNRVWDGSESARLTQDAKDKELEIFQKKITIN